MRNAGFPRDRHQIPSERADCRAVDIKRWPTASSPGKTRRAKRLVDDDHGLA